MKDRRNLAWWALFFALVAFVLLAAQAADDFLPQSKARFWFYAGLPVAMSALAYIAGRVSRRQRRY